MYYNRIAEQLTNNYLSQFRIVGIMGPRQSGKSTMIKYLLQNSYTYITFDKLENKNAFYDDPVKFLKLYNDRIIFDEAQEVPDLFPLLKIIVDENPENKGRFILTGSGQFLLSKNISESLAGRIGLITLLPMQIIETTDSYHESFIINGGYPEVVTQSSSNTMAYFDSYLNTYLQKDLRQMLNVSDLRAFTLFVRLLAARVGQHLNLSEISKEVGITVATLAKWTSVLEASYIIYLLRPYHNNLGKRLVKAPKVYFIDNGLLCYLTGIDSIKHLEAGVLKGEIFENFIITEILKSIYHKGIFAELFFIRTSHGEEVDLVIDYRSSVKLIEIKASYTYKPQFHKPLEKLALSGWSKNVIYQGETKQVEVDVKAWNFLDIFNYNLNYL